MNNKKLNKQCDWNKRFEYNGCTYMVNFDFVAEGREILDVEINQIFNLTTYEESTDPQVRLVAVSVATQNADDIINNHYEL